VFCDQALAVTTDPSEVADLLERAGEAGDGAGGHAPIIEVAQRWSSPIA
jgi:hypothetical protein